MRQQTLAGIGFERHRKITRRERFLQEMDRTVPGITKNASRLFVASALPTCSWSDDDCWRGRSVSNVSRESGNEPATAV